MFKFIHCADLHLDSPLRGLAEKQDAPVDDIRSATRRALENLVDLAAVEKVDFVLIAGDIYDGDWQDYSTGLFFNRQMNRLNEHGIPVFLIRGNHDAASVITRSLVLPENVKEFSVTEPETITLDDIQVAIHGQGYSRRDIRENLSARYPDPVPGYFNIGLLHTALEGQEGHAPYAPAHLDELVQKGYDYWALGHIHKRQIVHEKPYIVYPGNIQGRHIKETGEKGCSLVTVDGDIVTIEHRNLDVFRFYECHVDISGIETIDHVSVAIKESIQQYVDDYYGMPLALRVILTGVTPLHWELLHEEERYFHEVVNAASMVSHQVWIEKVRIKTAAPKDDIILARQGDALSNLLHHERIMEDDEFLQEILVDLQQIQRRLDARLATPYTKLEEATVIHSAADLEPLVKEAQDLLFGQLLKEGKEK